MSLFCIAVKWRVSCCHCYFYLYCLIWVIFLCYNVIIRNNYCTFYVFFIFIKSILVLFLEMKWNKWICTKLLQCKILAITKIFVFQWFGFFMLYKNFYHMVLTRHSVGKFYSSICILDIVLHAFFYKQRFFSTQPPCCLNFSWIEPQMLLRCCLVHISIIIMIHFLYFLYFYPCVDLDLFMSYLCDPFLPFFSIFIMINRIISWIQTHL